MYFCDFLISLQDCQRSSDGGLAFGGKIKKMIGVEEQNQLILVLVSAVKMMVIVMAMGLDCFYVLLPKLMCFTRLRRWYLLYDQMYNDMANDTNWQA